MTITGTFLDKGIKNASAQLQNMPVDTSFGKTFNAVSAKKEPVRTNNNRNQTYSKVNNNTKKADNSKEAYDMNKANSGNVEAKPDSTSTKVDSLNTRPVETAGNEKLSKEITKSVAKELGISSEALMEILAALNIQPTDLMDAKNVNLVVQKLMGAENPLELLSMEGVTELFSKIEDAVETAVENVRSQVNNDVAASANADGEKVDGEVFEQAGDEFDLTNEFGEGGLQAGSSTRVKTENKSTGSNTESGGEKQDSLFGNAEVEVNIEASGEINAGLGAQFNEIDTVNSAAPKAEAVRITNPQEVTNQIIERVKVDIKPGVSEIRMNLKPESLGEVSLRIASENGVVTAHFVAENQRVKELIESNFNQLQDALSEQGVNITELSVSVSNGNNERHMQEFIQGRAKSQSRISSIISGIGADGEILPTEPDETEIYENNVNYRA